MKISFFYQTVVMAFFFFSISARQSFAQSINNELKFNDDIDSLSFVLGVSHSNGLFEYLQERLDVDTAYISDYIKGVYVGTQSVSDPSQNAFYAGVQIGQQISNQMITGINSELFGDNETRGISMSHFLTGFVLGINNNSDEALFSKATKEVEILMEKIKDSNVTPEQKIYKKENEDWLVANKKKPGIHTLPSGLQYKIIKQGTGKKPTEESEVKCHYEGRLIDGTVFDSSYKRKEPITFRPNQVIKGWTDALLSMPAGSIWEVYIPQYLAYGNRIQDMIPAFSTLVFKLELISTKQ